MLSRCYKAELSKMIRSKSIYIALAVIVVLIVLLGVFANMLDVDNGNIPDGMGGGILSELHNLPREQYPLVISTLESRLALEDENTTMDSRFQDTKANIRTSIAVLKYLEAHEEIDVKNMVIPDNSFIGIAESSYNFLWVAMNIVTEIVIFYSVIMMSNVLAGEFKEGTLKMQLLRPNSRNTIITAKWLATFTMGSLLLIVGVILSVIYTAITFKFGSKDVLCVINNANVFVVDENIFALMQLIFSLISVFAMIQFSSFMCTITRFNRAASMAVPITVLLMHGFSAMLLQVAYLGIIDFPYNLDLTSFFIPQGMALPHSSLYTAIPVLMTYIAIFMTISYVKFNRAEV